MREVVVVSKRHDCTNIRSQASAFLARNKQNFRGHDAFGLDVERIIVIAHVVPRSLLSHGLSLR